MEKSKIRPIVTRITEPREVTVNGETFIAEETVILDYGKQGKTIGYIRAPHGNIDADMINSALARLGYRLAPMKNTGP